MNAATVAREVTTRGMQRFTDLAVWRLTHEVTLEVYRLTAGFPPDERFGLTSQLRRAAVSVGANLAEGSKRRGRVDYARFINLADSSLAETENLLIVARDLDYLASEAFDLLQPRIARAAAMLHGLRVSVERG